MRRNFALLLLPVTLRAQEAVSFDYYEQSDPWITFFSLVAVAAILWVIISTLSRSFKSREKTEIPRALIPKD